MNLFSLPPADRRATARTTNFVEPCSFQQKKRRSANDLAVFTGMSPERLCLGCRLRVVEPFSPLATGKRMKLFMAAHKLLLFVLHDASAQAFNDEERAFYAALKPLIGNEDGHVVAAVISLVQSLEGELTVLSVVSLVQAKLCLQLP